MPASPQIAIFAKAPIPGYAKTRLIPAVGEVGASRLHKKLVEHAVGQACQVIGARVQLHCSEAHPFFLRLSRRYPITLVPQVMGSVGARMQHVFANTIAPTLLMGSDCPSISSQILHQCIESLEKCNVVILPAEDGGYGLVGIKKSSPSLANDLFKGVPWGTPEVMVCTRENLRQQNISWNEPATIWDVDDPDDLIRLRSTQLVRF